MRLDLNTLVEDIKLELTGGVTHLEIEDEVLIKLVEKTLREIQRYTDETRIVTVPYTPCIDMKDSGVIAVSNVYRTAATGDDIGKSALKVDEPNYGIGTDYNSGYDGIAYDPAYLQFWNSYSGLGTYNLKDWAYNYASYSTINQIQNTISTDLNYYYDEEQQKLYINVTNKPNSITIEFVPVYNKVEDVQSPYWQDILKRLCIAYTKIALGRIRSKFTQTNALWTMDGETMLTEGNTELTELREILRTNSQMFYPLD